MFKEKKLYARYFNIKRIFYHDVDCKLFFQKVSQTKLTLKIKKKVKK